MNTETISAASQTEDQGYWQRHVEAYNIGEISKVNYCRANNVHYHRFLYWHNKLSKRIEAGALIPVKVKSNLSNEARCILELSQGSRILIYDNSLALKLLISVAK